MKYNSFKTIKGFSEYKLKEKGSVFIGQAFPLIDSEPPEEILKQIKKKFFEATHHCYAYRIDEKIFKFSDAGEPSGTAGIRILNAIDHFGLERILIIVIRYFGGTKLGVGPLGKAYYNTAYGTLEQSQTVTKEPYKKLAIKTDITLISLLYKVAAENEGKIGGITGENQYDVQIPLKKLDTFLSKIKQNSVGRIEIIDQEEIFFK